MLFFVGLGLLAGGLSGLAVFFFRMRNLFGIGKYLDTTGLILLVGVIVFCIACIIAGTIMIIVGYKKSHRRNEAAKAENLKNLMEHMTRCPVCGLNLASACKTCPACGTSIVRNSVAEPSKTRTTFSIPFSEDFLLTDSKIREILTGDGYKEMDKNGEIIWKMGTGMLTAIHFIKLEYTESTAEISGWVQSGMGDIGGKEMNLKGFVAIIPKKQVLKTISKIQAIVH